MKKGCIWVCVSCKDSFDELDLQHRLPVLTRQNFFCTNCAEITLHLVRTSFEYLEKDINSKIGQNNILEVKLFLEGKGCHHNIVKKRSGNYFKVGQFDNVYCIGCRNVISACIRKIEKKNSKGKWV